MRGFMSWWCVGLVACNGDPKPVDTTGDDDDTEECQEDSDCIPLVEICEEGSCERGDRDDEFEDATLLFLGEDRAEAGVLATRNDVDSYVYESLGDEWVSIRTVVDADAIDAGLDTVLVLHQANGAVHAEIDDFPVWPFRVTGFDSVLYAYLPTAGSWYITVQDASSYYEDRDPAFGEAFEYNVLVREAFGTQETDAVDNPSGTLDLPDGDTILTLGVVIDEPGDVDHVTIITPGEELLEVWSAVGIPGSDAIPLVSLYAGDELLGTKTGMGEEGYLSWFESTAGTYRLEAADASGTGGPGTWFPMFVRTYQPGDVHPFFSDNTYELELEPNDTGDGITLTADPVETTGGGSYEAFRLQGRVDAAGDVDPYRVGVTPGDLLSVRCWTDRFGSEALLRVTLSDGGTVLESSEVPDDDDFFLADVPAPTTGEATLTIEGVGPTFGAADWYRCALFAE